MPKQSTAKKKATRKKPAAKSKTAGGMERVVVKRKMPKETQRLHQKIDTERDPELIRRGRALKAQHEANQRTFADIMAALQQAREDAGVSLGELENRTDISKGRLSVLFNGRGNPTIDTVKRIAEALDCVVSVTVKPRGTQNETSA